MFHKLRDEWEKVHGRDNHARRVLNLGIKRKNIITQV
jgi:hypothetical protein